MLKFYIFWKKPLLRGGGSIIFAFNNIGKSLDVFNTSEFNRELVWMIVDYQSDFCGPECIIRFKSFLMIC